MYFEIENVPESIKRKKPEKPINEIPILILKPFSSPPTILLENVLINTTCTQILHLQNPKSEIVQVYISKKPDKINLQTSWEENFIGPGDTCALTFSWCPQEVISQRFILQINDKNKGRYDVIVICKSITRTKQPLKRSQAQVKKYGVRKSPLKLKTKSPKTKQINAYNNLEYLKKHIVSNDVKRINTYCLEKQTILNNINNLEDNIGNLTRKSILNSTKSANPESHFNDITFSNVTLNITNDKFHVSDMFSSDENVNFRRETYLIPNKNVYNHEKENTITIRQTPVKTNTTFSKNRRNPDISILSAIENMEFTPSKVYNNFVKKDHVDTKQHSIDTTFYLSNNSIKTNEALMQIQYSNANLQNEIEIKCEPLDLSHKSPIQLRKPIINQTHPIIDLDFSGISKIELNKTQNLINTQEDVQNNMNDIKTERNDEENIYQTPFNKNYVVLDNSIEIFEPNRCSTELKRNHNSLKMENILENFPCDSSLNNSNRRLSSETYTKGDSPIIPLNTDGNDYMHSSPYSMDISPLPESSGNSQCSRLLFSDNMRNFNERLSLKNAIKEKNTNSSAKFIIEANLWTKSPSLSPTPLSSIPEETSTMMSEMSMQVSKRVQSDTFIINETYQVQNPHNDFNKDVHTNQSNNSINIRKKWNKSNVRNTSTDISFKVPNMKTDIIDSKKKNIRISEKSNHTLDVYAMATVVDPFLASTYLYDEEAFNKLESEFKHWLNYLLTPPSDLDTEIDIDIGKAWIENRNKAIPVAPTREQISLKYHTSHRLESLRKAAKVLIKSHDVTKIFLKVTSQIERKLIAIRTDKNLHRDIGLQKIIMNLLLCYNPLWLRIGLEALYDKVIPLTSNDDIYGLSNFIIENMFRDPYVNSKHILIQSSYADNIKKFTLKKFLFLVYFLDLAKQKKIIFHDPCLFCRNAPYKQSKQILYQFTKELLSGIGDIVKHLKPTGYEVKHEQTYLDEFKYAVHNLAVDLKDGVRLTRLMEIILMEKGLTSNLRTPAISRLQKVHNVGIALNALKNANFDIIGDITSKDIADGHREKTLSLLWQLIHKFRAPLFENASIRIQKWWRTKYLKISLERRIENRKIKRLHIAVTCIQSWWRGIRCRKFVSLKKQIENSACVVIQKNWRMSKQKAAFDDMKRNIIKIQRFYRNYLLICNAQNELQRLREIKAAIIIQRWYKKNKIRNILKSQNYERAYFLQLKSSVEKMQKLFRANILMKKSRKTFITLKISTIKIQRCYRSLIKTRIIRCQYLTLKSATITIQNRYRANIEMKYCKNAYERKRDAILKIQQYYKNYLMMKKYRTDFLILRSAVIFVQKYYRNKLLTRILRNKYSKQKESAIIIQRYFRSYFKMKSARNDFMRKKHAALIIQRNYRALVAMRNERIQYTKLKSAALFTQQRFRAKLEMRIQRLSYRKQREAAIKIQRYYRSLLNCRNLRKDYLKKRNLIIFIQRKFRENKIRREENRRKLMLHATIKIQQWYRSIIYMKQTKNHYLLLRNTAVKIQQRYRNKLLAKQVRMNFIQLKSTCIYVQKYYRNKKLSQNIRKHYSELKTATIFLQRKYRDYCLMRENRNAFLNLKRSALIIQRVYRNKKIADKTKQQYLSLKCATVFLQRIFRANKAMKIERRLFLEKKKSALLIQRYFRGRRLTRIFQNEFIRTKSAAITIQRFYRSWKNMKNIRNDYIKKRESILKIQCFYRSYLQMKRIQCDYLELKMSTLIIQRYYRNYRITKVQRMWYLKLLNSVKFIQEKYRANKLMISNREEFLMKVRSALIIQRYFRGYLHMKMCRAEFIRKKSATLAIQRLYRSWKCMTNIKNVYVQQRNSAINIQRFYRSYLRMKRVRYDYLKVKDSALIIQRYYRNYQLAKMQKAEYLKLLNIVKFVQLKYRANRLMKLERRIFLEKIQSVLLIQRYFRGYLLMKICQNDFIRKKSAAITIQRFYRSWKSMIITRNYYNKQRNSIITIQMAYRSYLQMKRVRYDYLKLKVSALTIQRYYRNYKLTQIKRMEYLKLLNIVKFIQNRYRANKLRETERETFLEKKKSALIIQRYFRGYLYMKMCRIRFIQKKSSAIIIQRFYRSWKKMKNTRNDYVQQINSILIIQSFYRSYLQMKRIRCDYLKLKISTLIIQRYYRNYRITQIQRTEYLKLLNSVKFIQEKYRANKLMRSNRAEFLKKVQSTLIIQRNFRGYLLMKMCRVEFMQKKSAALVIQRFYRSFRTMINIRIDYINRRKSAIIIQKFYRSYLQMKRIKYDYLKMRLSALTIQRYYRNYRLAQRERAEYLKLLQNVKFVQRKFRSNTTMRCEREMFLKKTKSILIIQRYFRAYLLMKTHKSNLTQIKNIRANIMHSSKKHVSLKTIVQATIKIQAYWKGYNVRKMQEDDSRIKNLRKRWQQGALQSSQLTLAERNDDALDVLGHFRDIASVIRAFKSLDLTTSVCPMMYNSKTANCIATRLIMYMDATNRSVSTLETLQLGTSILINLTRYEPTSHFVYNIDSVNTIIILMMRWCDKDSVLSRSFCTLLWLFGKYERNVKELTEFLQSDKSYKILCKIRSAIVRKKRMECRKRPVQNSNTSIRKSITPTRKNMTPVKNAISITSIALPMTEPDYGIKKSTPKIFQDDVFAIDSIFLRYNLNFNNVDEK